MKFSSEFASCGLNPVPHCIDCHHQNGACFVAFGSSHSVVVTRIPDGSPEGCGGTIVMVSSIDQKDTVSHNKVPETDAVVGDYRDMESYIPTPRVNTVKFVGDDIHLLVGTSDGRILLYKDYEGKDGEPTLVKSLGPYLTKTTDLFYSPSILCIDTLFYSQNKEENNNNQASKLLIVATTACGLALIWDGFDTFMTADSPQMVKLGNCLLEACAIGIIANTPLIALGCTDNKTRILCKASDNTFAEGACLVGHLDWVRSLAFSPSFIEDEKKSILLATGSQDTNIRIWRITLVNSINNSITIETSLDSVLNGHDDWVTGVAWCGPKRLLSVSMDRTLSLWLPDADAGVWINSVRLWGVPGSLLGGSVFGFHSLALAPGGTAVFAHGYTGAIHRWDFTPSLSDPSLSATNPPSAVQRATVPAGHTNFVTSVAWSHVPGCPPYLVSAGEDKTVRIYAQQKGKRWYELARPLIHGHSVRRMCVVGHKHTFAVASEEKAIRLFDAPSTFVKSLFNIAGEEIPQNVVKDADSRPFGAVLPPLSLSNRPVYKTGDNNITNGDDDSKASSSSSTDQNAAAAPSQPDEEEEYEVNEEEGNEGDLAADCPSTPTELFAPPFEDHLTHNTMWPESRKLFAHVSEATCVTSSRSVTESPVVVSGCSAFRAGEATVCVWNPDAHVPVAVLQRHRGPVVDVCVSNDGKFALSISLDMSIMLWGNSQDGNGKWSHLFTQERAFTKPPIACRWSPVCDIVAIASPAVTGVHLYRVGDLGNGQMCCSKCGEIPTKSRSTSVAWLPACGADSPLILAVGMDSGDIEVWRVERPTLETNVAVELVGSVPTGMAHVSSVNSLDWSDPVVTDDGDGGCGKWSALLASGGSDNFVRITKISN